MSSPIRPEPAPPSVRRAAPPNLLLDPHGISGTGTARRLRLSRHRRQLQTVAFGLLLALGIVALGWLALRPRVAGFAVAERRELPFPGAAPAALSAGDALWSVARDGTLWHVAPDGQAQRFGAVGAPANAPPLVGAGAIYVAALDGSLLAFGAAPQPRWRRDLGGAISTTPALVRDATGAILGVGNDDGTLNGLDAATGETQWTLDVGGPIGNAVIATPGDFLVPTLSGPVENGGLVCVDARTGALKWRFPDAPNLEAAGVAAPLFDAQSNRVFWNNDEGAVFCLDVASGAKVWKSFVAPLRTDSPFAVMLRAAPVLMGDALFVGGNDGTLRALDARSGQARWMTQMPGPIATIARADETALLVTCETGQIVLADARSGAILRRTSGQAAWPTSKGKSAIVTDDGAWERVSWY